MDTNTITVMANIDVQRDLLKRLTKGLKFKRRYHLGQTILD